MILRGVYMYVVYWVKYFRHSIVFLWNLLLFMERFLWECLYRNVHLLIMFLIYQKVKSLFEICLKYIGCFKLF